MSKQHSNGNGPPPRTAPRPTAPRATRATRSASRSSASATAPRRSCRASSTTRTPTRPSASPASCTSTSAATTSATSSSRPPSTSTRQGRQGPRRGDLGRPEQHDEVRQGAAKLGVPVHRGMTHDGLGKYLKEKITKAPGETADIVADPQGDAHRRRRLLPAGRLRAGDQVVRRAGARGRLRLRQLHPGVHRPRGLLGQALQEGRPADRRRRHQVAGRRDDRAPHARAPVRRPRREDAAHLAAERRRQHGLLQHARARAAGVQEDLEDQRRHLDHGRRRCPPTTSTSARPTTCRG